MEHEKQSCTFRPMIDNSFDSLQKSLIPDYNKMNTTAIEKFLERQADARLRKETADEMAKSKPGSGNSWQNKVTKPKPPKLLKHVKSNSKIIEK